MLSFQEGMGEMSHKQQNLILTSLQFRKNYQCPLRRFAVRFSVTILSTREIFSSCVAKIIVQPANLDFW